MSIAIVHKIMPICKKPKPRGFFDDRCSQMADRATMVNTRCDRRNHSYKKRGTGLSDRTTNRPSDDTPFTTLSSYLWVMILRRTITPVRLTGVQLSGWDWMTERTACKMAWATAVRPIHLCSPRWAWKGIRSSSVIKTRRGPHSSGIVLMIDMVPARLLISAQDAQGIKIHRMLAAM